MNGNISINSMVERCSMPAYRQDQITTAHQWIDGFMVNELQFNNKENIISFKINEMHKTISGVTVIQ